MRIRRRGHAPDQCAFSARGRPGSRGDGGLALAPIEDRCQRMVAQLLSEFLKLHAACAGLPEFFEVTASLAGYSLSRPPWTQNGRSCCLTALGAVAPFRSLPGAMGTSARPWKPSAVPCLGWLFDRANFRTPEHHSRPILGISCIDRGSRSGIRARRESNRDETVPKLRKSRPTAFADEGGHPSLGAEIGNREEW
jgi:hypothetical protein